MRSRKPYRHDTKPDKQTLSYSPESMMAEVRDTLNLGSKRYEVKNGNLFLDGQHASVGEVVKEANRLRHKWGMSQFGRNPEWLI